MPNAIIFSKDYCPYCDYAKALLKEKGISYEEINISHSDNPALVLEKIRSYTDMRTFPQIILDGKHIGGYTDLVAYYAEENSNI